MSGQRLLIVNADDLGLSLGINEGIFQAHQFGIVTSASLMVLGPAAAAAVDRARPHARLALGLHLDFGEWVYQDGSWTTVYQRVALGDRDAVAVEVAHQLAEFHHLVGHAPTHLDSHQQVHNKEPARSILRELANRLGIPLRQQSPEITYRGNYYGRTKTGLRLPGALSIERLIAILQSLAPGITELGCHPGLGTDPDLVYNEERAEELRALCDPRARAAIDSAGILLRSFGDLRGDRAPG
jgi:predicted glycoside hydrolase/deacetylase ChbG (UPF0249 family)